MVDKRPIYDHHYFQDLDEDFEDALKFLQYSASFIAQLNLNIVGFRKGDGTTYERIYYTKFFERGDGMSWDEDIYQCVWIYDALNDLTDHSVENCLNPVPYWIWYRDTSHSGD